jgi:hypothetical protein
MSAVPISNVVSIDVSLLGAKLAQDSFGVGAILSNTVGFTSRTISISAASELVAYGFSTTSDEYLAASLYFGQSVKPSSLKVLRRQVDDVDIAITTVADNTEYTATINDTDFTIDSGGSATDLTIAAALVAAINGGSEPVTATDNSDGTYSLTNDVAGVAYSVLVDSGQTIGALTAAGTVTDDLIAIEDADSAWYQLIQIKPVLADAVLAAAWVASANLKVHSVWDDSATTYDAAEIGGTFKANGYQRSVVEYHSASNLAAAHAGYYLPQTPGSASFQYNELIGLAADDLTATARSNMAGANVVTFQSLADRNVTIGRSFADGTSVFVIHGADNFVFGLQNKITAALIDLPKLPLDLEGRARLTSLINQQLKEGIDDGFIRANPDNPNQALNLDPVTGLALDPVFVPLPDDLPAADKANGIYSGVTIAFNYAQETTKVEISLNLQV